MTPLFPAQRAAEEFDRALGGTATPAVTERYAELLDTVEALRSQPEVSPRPDFVDDLRSRLLTAAESELVSAPPLPRRLGAPRTPRHRRRIATLAASLVIMGGSAGMAAAASGSLPGDPLYPLKRGVEQASTIVRVGDAAKGRSLLDHGAARLDEVRDLQALGSPDSQLTRSTIDSFRNAAYEGAAKLFSAYAASGDPADITAVRTFIAEQMALISELSGTSATTDEALLAAADTLAAIDQQALSLCPTCGPETPLALPGQLSTGAGATTVDGPLVGPVSPAGVDVAGTRPTAIERPEGTEQPAGERADDVAPSGETNTAPAGTATGRPESSTPPPDSDPVPAGDGGTAVRGPVPQETDSPDPAPTTDPTPEPPPLESTVEDLPGTVDDVTDDDPLPDDPCTPVPEVDGASGCPEQAG